ncbi:transglutaminase domain-containing protein [Thermodesulfobacteriota bacterium]
MKTPPMLLGTALLFWGWQTGLWPFALVMAAILEGSRFVKTRLVLSPSDFNRISDLCSLIVLGMFIYLLASSRSARAILMLLQWLPIAFLPLMMAQAFGSMEKINTNSLFLIFRRKGEDKESGRYAAINLSFPYFAQCLLSASAANWRSPWFYLALFLLTAWALWFYRSKRFSPALWALLLLLAGSTGYLGHVGLHQLQTTLEKKMLGWFGGLTREDIDPYRTRTAIGELGTLKLSDRILFRVKREPSDRDPLLLREACYNAYKSSLWFALHSRFDPVRPEKDGTTWKLRSDPGRERQLRILATHKRGKGMLKLPNGSFEISRLPVSGLVGNPYGAYKAENGPGFVNYLVRFNPHQFFDSPPDETDLLVPQRESPALRSIVSQFGLTAESTPEVLKKLENFFQENFDYSLILKRGGVSSSPLTNFLLQTRTGHCEYFATATVLLLRTMGIPARYATGYAAQEFSDWEDCYVVRARHAHSWALAYVNGSWRDFDTTPASWPQIEAGHASSLEPFYDIWAWLMLKISEWRWRESESALTKHLIWLLIPLILILAKRIYSRGRIGRGGVEGEKEARTGPRPGLDSEFYLIEKRLNDLGFMRHPWETLSRWINRIDGSRLSPSSTASLRTILNLHYRYRFDPQGITPHEKRTLNDEVHAWLAAHPQSNGRTFDKT